MALMLAWTSATVGLWPLVVVPVEGLAIVLLAAVWRAANRGRLFWKAMVNVELPLPAVTSTAFVPPNPAIVARLLCKALAEMSVLTVVVTAVAVRVPAPAGVVLVWSVPMAVRARALMNSIVKGATPDV